MSKISNKEIFSLTGIPASKILYNITNVNDRFLLLCRSLYTESKYHLYSYESIQELRRVHVGDLQNIASIIDTENMRLVNFGVTKRHFLSPKEQRF